MKKVVVIGDVIEDIIVISNQDRKANTDNPSSIKSTPGGSGANFAVWLASLGVETELIARVSSYDVSRLERYFKKVNVQPSLQADQELETGKIVVLVEGNQRTFFTDRAANLNLQPPTISNCDLLYVSGYSVLSLGVENTQRIIRRAKQNGAMVAVDPGSVSFIESFGASEFLVATHDSDILFPNQEEFELLRGAGLREEHYLELVITKGEHGAELIGAGEAPAVKVQVIDSTGAGDAFAARYISERLHGRTPMESLVSANKFAAQAVTKVGGQSISKN